MIAQTSRCRFGVGESPESLVIGVVGHLSIVFSGDEGRVRACGVCGRPAHFANGSGHKIMRRDYGCHFVNSSRRSHRCLPHNLTSFECCEPCSKKTSGGIAWSQLSEFSHKISNLGPSTEVSRSRNKSLHPGENSDGPLNLIIHLVDQVGHQSNVECDRKGSNSEKEQVFP